LEFRRQWRVVKDWLAWKDPSERPLVKAYIGTDAALKDVKALMGAREV
jgi:hypothetical protein